MGRLHSSRNLQRQCSLLPQQQPVGQLQHSRRHRRGKLLRGRCTPVADKCGGNTDSTTDYTCPTGYDPKANPSSIDSASTDDAVARTAACCDAQTCATVVCTTGYTAKTDQSLAAGTEATLANCCDVSPSPSPSNPASSSAATTGTTAAALLAVAFAHGY